MQRQELLTRYPKYAGLLDRVQALRSELKSTSLAVVGVESLRKQADKLTEFGRVAAEKEVLLHEMAVRRETAELAFPPLHPAKAIQAGLGAEAAIADFLFDARQHLRVADDQESPRRLEARIVAGAVGTKDGGDAARSAMLTQIMSWLPINSETKAGVSRPARP